MKIVNAKKIGREAVEKLLMKKSFDEVELSPKVRAANKKIFGEDLSAIEIVRKIISDVRKFGDAAVVDYTKKIDGVELENFSVALEDFKIDSKIFSSLKVAARRTAAKVVDNLSRRKFFARPSGHSFGARRRLRARRHRSLSVKRLDEYHSRESRRRQRNYHVHAQRKRNCSCRRKTRGRRQNF